MSQPTLKIKPAYRRAAWRLYVELVTRIAVQPLPENEGLLREALHSLYSLFETVRSTLKEAGPDVGAAPDTLGGITLAMLNQSLRPFMVQWHPALQDWEARRSPDTSAGDHERAWSEAQTMRAELEQLRQEMQQYTNVLRAIVQHRDDA